MKTSLFPRHTATLLQYIGIGLISGAISHGFFSGFRSLVTALIGIVIFVFGLWYERNLTSEKINIGRVLIIGVIFSISTAMVAGGIQHFLDSPWRSAWIIPVGYFISVLVFREKESIKNPFYHTLFWTTIISIILLVVSYSLASITPAQFDNHHEEKNTTHHTNMNHADMVTSEETFLVNMIPHHQEAVDTARLIVAKSTNTELIQLAQNIITEQEKEINMMRGWLENGNYDTTLKPSYKKMMGDGTQLTGEALDIWFLEGMIGHHQGALEMAEAVLKIQTSEKVAAFAREIIKVQSQEISAMQSILGHTNMHQNHH